MELYIKRPAGEGHLARTDEKVYCTHTNPTHFSSNEEGCSFSVTSKFRKQMEGKVLISCLMQIDKDSNSGQDLIQESENFSREPKFSNSWVS